VARGGVVHIALTGFDVEVVSPPELTDLVANASPAR
jgi:hypothetical protein